MFGSVKFQIFREHDLFDYLNTNENYEVGLLGGLGGLLIPEVQGEDYEEQDFANRMKKKRRHKRDR